LSVTDVSVQPIVTILKGVGLCGNVGK